MLDNRIQEGLFTASYTKCNGRHSMSHTHSLALHAALLHNSRGNAVRVECAPGRPDASVMDSRLRGARWVTLRDTAACF